MANKSPLPSPSRSNTDKKLLMVFDFDWSLVDGETDHWGPEVLAPKERQRMEDLRESTQWTDLVADTMMRMHKQGITREQIEQAQKILPFHPAMKRAVRNLKQRYGDRVTFLCLSNSNEFFINTILEHHGMQDIFDQIITNPAHFDNNGTLIIKRRIDPSGPQHSCSIGCSPNMCKGEELTKFLEQRNGIAAFTKVVYTGDGENDFCPILRLRPQDVTFVRTHRGLEARVNKEGSKRGLRCSIRKWGEAWEAEKLMDGL